MKKILLVFILVCVVLAFAACVEENQAITEKPTPAGLFEGKIAIISTSNIGTNREYDAAQMVVEKYGMDKITHVTWPANFIGDQEQMIKIVEKLGADSDIKAIIVNQALPGSNTAFDTIKKAGGDIFIAYISPQDSLVGMVQRATILLSIDEVGMSSAMVQQAQKFGAKTFVHYSIPKDMQQTDMPARLELIRGECEKLGIEFIDATALDPASAGFQEADKFILDDVSKMVEKYGKDTAFFATKCLLQVAIIKAVAETGAIYPQPCCPSPYHGLIEALDLDRDAYIDERLQPAKEIIALERAALAERNMLGRLSTWPIEPNMMFTEVSAEYAIKRLNGEVQQEGVDVDVLKQLMEDYAGVEVYLTPYTDDETGETYDNYFLVRMDYITFE